MSDDPAPSSREDWPADWDPWAESPEVSAAERAEYARLWREKEARNSARRKVSQGSSPSSSPVRPQLSSSLRPIPLGRDEDEQFVPEFVPEPHSWMPVDLVEAGQNPTSRPDLIDLFYVGKNHLLSGETESMKTWLVGAAAVTEIKAGRGVLWIDGDDVGPSDIMERLLLLGASEADVSARFAYVLPDEPLETSLIPSLLEVVRERSCRLAVFDGFNPLLALHGLDPNSGVDVERFYRLIDPIRKAPTASVLTDNVVKSKETRGSWAIGSERKKSKAEVHLGMRTLEPLVRGGTGRARMDVHKDRPGHLQRPVCGFFVVESGADGCTWRIEPDDSHDEQGEFRPTALMLKVSRYLELHEEPASRNQIERRVTGKAEFVRLAIDRLIEEGYATEYAGPNRARLVRLERAFLDDVEVEGNL